jgi:hypothetical protein
MTSREKSTLQALAFVTIAGYATLVWRLFYHHRPDESALPPPPREKERTSPPMIWRTPACCVRIVT